MDIYIYIYIYIYTQTQYKVSYLYLFLLYVKLVSRLNDQQAKQFFLESIFLELHNIYKIFQQ